MEQAKREGLLAQAEHLRSLADTPAKQELIALLFEQIEQASNDSPRSSMVVVPPDAVDARMAAFYALMADAPQAMTTLDAYVSWLRRFLDLQRRS